MAVDLADYVEALEIEVNPPGQDLYSSVTDSQWLARLQNAFWEIRLHGMLSNFTEEEGVVTPISGDTDLTRDQIQLIILFAAYTVALSSFQNIKSSYRAKAGPVEVEYQQSAQTLKSLLDALRSRINFIIGNLSGYAGTTAFVIDAVQASQYSIGVGDTWYVDA